MIGTSFSQLIFIRICIFLLKYGSVLCALGSAVLAAAHGKHALTRPLGLVLIGYALLDLLYAVFIYMPYNRRLADEAQHPPPLPSPERRAVFLRCIDHVADLDRYLQLWFLGADESEIRRDNVRDFLLWAFFDRPPGQESDEEVAEAEEFIDIIEQKSGRKLQPGRGRAQSLRLTLDPIVPQYRGFVWFVIVGIVDLITHCHLARSGFRYHAQPTSSPFSVIPPRVQSLTTQQKSASKHLGYWHRPHTAKDRLPVLFLHGIGIGLWPYTSFLSSIPQGEECEGDIGVLAVEILPVSFRLTRAPLSRLELLEELKVILNAHGWDKFVLTSHSYGSVLVTHMLRSEDLGPRVDSVVLVDPVSIMLHLPDVAYNFTRRRPRRANEWQLWYFACTDPGVAYALGRHFFWKENIVWKGELLGVDEAEGLDRTAAPCDDRRRVAVCLAGRDLIVDTFAVAQYLAGDQEWLPPRGTDAALARYASQVGNPTTKHGQLTRDGIEILWFDDLDHQQVFEQKPTRDEICDVVRRYCRR